MNNIYFLLMMVMIIWGFNVSAVKVLVMNIDPILLTSVRIFTAGITVLIICKFLKIFRLPNKKELYMIIIISIFNVVTHHMFVAIGLNETSAVNSGLILGMGPLLTMILALYFIDKKVVTMKIIGFILGFVGIVITTLSSSTRFTKLSIGDFLVFLGVLTQAISFIQISKMDPKLDPRLLTGYMLVFGSVLVFIFSFYNTSNIGQITKLFDWKLGLIFLYSAVVATACGHMIYNFAIKKVGPAESAIFINFNTVFALLGAVLFLKEQITIGHLIGLLFIVLGVIIGSGGIDFIKKRIPSNHK